VAISAEQKMSKLVQIGHWKVTNSQNYSTAKTSQLATE